MSTLDPPPRREGDLYSVPRWHVFYCVKDRVHCVAGPYLTPAQEKAAASVIARLTSQRSVRDAGLEISFANPRPEFRRVDPTRL